MDIYLNQVIFIYFVCGYNGLTLIRHTRRKRRDSVVRRGFELPDWIVHFNGNGTLCVAISTFCNQYSLSIWFLVFHLSLFLVPSRWLTEVRRSKDRSTHCQTSLLSSRHAIHLHYYGILWSYQPSLINSVYLYLIFLSFSIAAAIVNPKRSDSRKLIVMLTS